MPREPISHLQAQPFSFFRNKERNYREVEKMFGQILKIRYRRYAHYCTCLFKCYTATLVPSYHFWRFFKQSCEESGGSVIECLTLDQGVVCLSLTRGTVLCP